ncbi:hypothetical protein [Pseudonocardia nigra]|uniref:hypothetical protein n=1 Tax=Pseudonocardia nigra TaxID=1921578 RepID=UPI001FE33E98|nr:hypothetical protein [Pseudonocardia nigra]
MTTADAIPARSDPGQAGGPPAVPNSTSWVRAPSAGGGAPDAAAGVTSGAQPARAGPAATAPAPPRAALSSVRRGTPWRTA